MLANRGEVTHHGRSADRHPERRRVTFKYELEGTEIRSDVFLYAHCVSARVLK